MSKSHKIEVFTTPTCRFCNMVKDFFKKHNMDIDLFLLSNMIKVESFLMLATLAFRKGSTEEKNMWKKYLLETLKL